MAKTSEEKDLSWEISFFAETNAGSTRVIDDISHQNQPQSCQGRMSNTHSPLSRTLPVAVATIVPYVLNPAIHNAEQPAATAVANSNSSSNHEFGE
jgi:hypothetical protein